MNDEVKKILVRSAVAVFVAVVLFAVLQGYAYYASNIEHTIEFGTNDSDHRFEYTISKQWSEEAHGYYYGQQCDIEVENLRSSAMLDWVMKIDVANGSRLDSSWNGIFSLENNVVTVTPVDYNETVEPNEVQPFGMVIYSNSEDCIKGGELIYHENIRVTDMPLFWAIMIFLFVMLVMLIDGLFYAQKNYRMRQKQNEAFTIINQSFMTFASTIDAKDSYTKGHSQRVAFYARELAKRMGFDEDFQRNIFYVGLLHDIGKIGVQDAILKKSTKLTYDEFNEIKEHVTMGGDILKNFTAIKGIRDGARYHHEKYDGSGYMEGLKGEEIPLQARIIAVADAFDAMSSARCYRPAMSMEAIRKELEEGSGKQFDPQIVPHMVDMINERIAPIVLGERQLENELSL